MEHLQVQVDKNDQSPAAKRRKRFNALLQKIDQLKDSISNLEIQMQSGMVFYHAELAPLYKKQRHATADYIRNLYKFYDDKAFTRKDRKKLAHIILESCEEILGAIDTDEKESYADIRAIFDEFSERTWEEIQEDQRREVNRSVSDIFADMGVDLAIDPDDDMDAIQEKIVSAAARAEQEAAEKEESKARAPKNKKMMEKESARREESLNVRKISKTIYNELVKLLHPDLEQDETRKAEKTEAMKKVNEAWQNNDFFGLLTLQSAYLQKHGDHIAQLPDKQFNYYISVLKDQKTELEQELGMLERAPGISGYIYRKLVGASEYITNILRERAVSEEKNDLVDRQHNLLLSLSPETFKPSLKKYKIQEQDFSFLDMISVITAMENATQRKSKNDW